MNYFIVEQLPTLPPDRYDKPCPWAKGETLESWVSERALKLTCTADDLVPLAVAAGFAGDRGGVWPWDAAERAALRAELDAAYFLLYGYSRDDVDHALTTFQSIAAEDARAGGAGPTRRAVLAAYDDLSPGLFR